MPTKNSDEIIKPVSFCNLDELNSILDRLPDPLPPRLYELFLVDKYNETYFLLDIAELSEKTAKKYVLWFESIIPNSISTSYTISEIRQAYHENDTKLLGQLRFNRLVAQALETIGKNPAIENLSKMEDALTCNISHKPYIFPMLTPHGQTYERSDIVTYFQSLSNPTDPLTQRPCSVAQLIPNKAAQQLVQLMYQYANVDQQKTRIDDLKAKKEEIWEELVGLPISFVELPMEAVVQEKEKLIKKRDRLSMFTSGRRPVIVHIGVFLLMAPMMAIPISYFLMAAENKISAMPRTTEGRLEVQLDTLRQMFALLLAFIGLMVGAGMITFTFSGDVNTYLHRRETSLNEQIAQLSDWVNGSEDRSQRLKALDQQIEKLNKLLAPQKSPGITEFFQNPRRRVMNFSSEPVPPARMVRDS